MRTWFLGRTSSPRRFYSEFQNRRLPTHDHATAAQKFPGFRTRWSHQSSLGLLTIPSGNTYSTELPLLILLRGIFLLLDIPGPLFASSYPGESDPSSNTLLNTLSLFFCYRLRTSFCRHDFDQLTRVQWLYFYPSGHQLVLLPLYNNRSHVGNIQRPGHSPLFGTRYRLGFEVQLEALTDWRSIRKYRRYRCVITQARSADKNFLLAPDSWRGVVLLPLLFGCQKDRVKMQSLLTALYYLRLPIRDF